MSTSRPLFWYSIAFMAGILLARQANLPVPIWLGLSVAALIFGALWYFLTKSGGLHDIAAWVAPSTLFLILLCLGSARYQSSLRDFTAFDLAWYNDREYDVLVTGWVAEPPDLRDAYANLRVSTTGMDTGGGEDLPIKGYLLARVDPNQTYEYGDIVRLRGRLKSPPENEDFSYREYLARQNVHSYMTSAEVTSLPGKEGNLFYAGMYAFQQKALATIYRLFPDPEASLLAGILLGVDNGLPDDLQQAFKDTGTAHIIAISGFNIAIIAELFLSLFGRLLGPRRGAFVAAIGIGFYTLLVGADAAVVRAAVMGLLALFARHVGRRQDGLNTLFAVAFIMALINPLWLWDAGFQLSFAATLGLVLYAQPLEQFTIRLLTRYTGTQVDTETGIQVNTETGTQVDTYTGTQVNTEHATSRSIPVGRNLALSEVEGTLPPPPSTLHASPSTQPNPRVAQASSLISNFFLLTLAAQVTTLPIMAYHFNRLSLVSFIANPFILPAQPAVMILGGLSVLLGMIFQPLGQVSAFATWPFVAYTIQLVDFFADLPGAAVSVDFPFWAVLAWYVALLGLTVGRVPLKEWIRRLGPRLPKVPAWGAIAALTLAALLIWRAALSIPDGKLHITFLNVGSSDAILIQGPNGGTVLVNGGDSLSQVSSQLGQRLPLFHRRLDWLIVASTQENQVAALPRLLERYPPDRVLWAGNVEASYSARALDEWLRAKAVPVTLAEPDQTLDLGDGATLKVLTAGPRGAILLIEYKGFKAILPLGMNFDTLEELEFGETIGPVTVLMLGDSGFPQVNPPEWIGFLNPQLVVLNVAAGDINGLPGRDVLESLGEIQLLRTDVNGWIQVTSDGESLWVEVERSTPVMIPTLTPAVTLTPEGATEPPAAPTEELTPSPEATP